jgi:glycerophosphoryl diester phosphodiesterase
VFHYYYLETVTTLTGPIFNYTYKQLTQAKFANAKNGSETLRISTLEDVLTRIGGKIDLEIEIKGPEPESVPITAGILRKFQNLWETMEITSFEVTFLSQIKSLCPGITTDLLFPRSEPWMELDVVAYKAANLGKLAGARAVHLHPSQLSKDVLRTIRDAEIVVHAWDVNTQSALESILEWDIPRICTDHFEMAANFRKQIFA